MFPFIEFPIREDIELDTLIHSNTSIFHYMDSDTFFTKVYGGKGFRCCNLELTNDPFEYKSPEVYSIPYQDTIRKVDNEFCSDVVREIVKLRKRMCIACFCYNEDDSLTKYDSDTKYLYYAQKGFEHSRMWSQYGEDHRGLCLVFNKKLFLEEVNRICEMKHLVFSRNIRYVQKQVLFPNYEDIMQSKTVDSVEAAKEFYSLGKNLTKILFTKDIDYEKEKEFRVAFYSEKDYEYLNLSSLKAIIIGDRFPDHLGCSIGEVANELNIPVVKMNYYGGLSELSVYYRKEKIY